MSVIKLSYEQLLEYIRMVLELEKNDYIQKKTSIQLENKIKRLGQNNDIKIPEKEMEVTTASISWGIIKVLLISLLVGGGIGLATLIVCFVILPWFKIKSGMNGMADGYMETQRVSITVTIISAIIAFIFTSIIQLRRSKKKMNRDNEKMHKYHLAVENDRQRVEKEKIQKEYLQEEYRLLATQRIKTIGHLKQLYRYGIIEPEYRNIVAVSAFYHYLKTGMTRSLAFDPETHDDGAYKIYRQEMMLGKIITNTEIIIQKLDSLIDSQNELKQIIFSANKKVDNLVYKIDSNISTINKLSNTVSKGFDTMHRDSEITRYNQEITNTELEFMNRMNTWKL